LADYATASALLEQSQAMAGECLDALDAPMQAKFRWFWLFIGGQIALHEGRYEPARTLLSQILQWSDASGSRM
jgi:hypothetical protein